MFEMNEELSEFYGVLLGDGCISKFNSQNREKEIIRIDGNSKTDLEYYTYLQGLIKKITDREVKINFRKNKNAIFITFHNKNFSNYLNKKLKFPYGKKKGMVVPLELLEGKYIRKILRGFFDTDGSIYFTKNNKKRKGRTYPIIELSSHNIGLIKQLLYILKKLGFRPILSFYGDSVKLHGNYNVKKWMNEIGSSNPYKRIRYDTWKKYGEYIEMGPPGFEPGISGDLRPKC